MRAAMATMIAFSVLAGIASAPAHAGSSHNNISAAGGTHRPMVDCEWRYCRTISADDVPASVDMDLVWDYSQPRKAADAFGDWPLQSSGLADAWRRGPAGLAQ